MKAGAGKSEIVLAEEYLEIEDFAVIHRTLNARAVVIESGQTVVLLSLEVTSLPDEETLAIRQKIAKKYPVKESNIWVCVTHTFSAPHLLPDFVLKEKEKIAQKAKYREELVNASLEAVGKGFADLQNASIGYGDGYSMVNCSRDVQLEDGWWVGIDGPGLSDHRVFVVRINKENGTPLAAVFHYGLQSSVLDGSVLSAGGKAVSPDVAGIACDYVEKKMGDDSFVALFLIGAAGDQAPVEKAVSETFVRGERIRRDRKEEGFGICEKLGNSLGETVCQIADQVVCTEKNPKLEFGRCEFAVPGKEMERELKRLHPVKAPAYTAAEDKTTSVEAICLGNLALVGVKPELNCGTGVAIRTLSPYPHTLICTMVNGGAKYMAERDSYDRSTYEAMNSPFGKGAAEILMKETLGLLEQMKGQAV